MLSKHSSSPTACCFYAAAFESSTGEGMRKKVGDQRLAVQKLLDAEPQLNWRARQAFDPGDYLVSRPGVPA